MWHLLYSHNIWKQETRGEEVCIYCIFVLHPNICIQNNSNSKRASSLKLIISISCFQPLLCLINTAKKKSNNLEWKSFLEGQPW